MNVVNEKKTLHSEEVGLDEDYGINGSGISQSCAVFGGLDHWARECSQGGGKVEGGGNGKGKGGAKGEGRGGSWLTTGCWECG